MSFANQTFSRVYGNAALFGVKFFGMDELITQTNITPSDYNTLYPLFTFGVSKQKEKLKSSVSDIQIKANFTENVPASSAYFRHFSIQYRIDGKDWIDPDLFLDNSKQSITNIFIVRRQTKVKLILSCMIEKVDLKSGEVIVKEVEFHSKTEVNLESTDSSELFSKTKKLF